MKGLKRFLVFAIIAAFAEVATGGKAMAMQITSAAFTQNSAIPSKYTCDGAGISPPLAWSEAPSGTRSFALIADDPDAPAGTWVHWVAWNIPATATSLKEGVGQSAALADGTKQGLSDFRKAGYGGPCPPSGAHRYVFKLYALDSELNLPATATKANLESAMKGHILAEAQVMGKYERKR